MLPNSQIPEERLKAGKTRRSRKFLRGTVVGVFLGILLTLPLYGPKLLEILGYTKTPNVTKAGKSYYGEKTDVQVPAGLDIELRHKCKWGNPGANPFIGDVTTALLVMGLDIQSAKTLTYRIKTGQKNEDIVFTNSSIFGKQSNSWYGDSFTGTFGNTACFGTTVNFKENHTENAALYLHTSAIGEEFHIAVPYVCGNVSRLFILPYCKAIQSSCIAYDEEGQCTQKVGAIPEPGTIWLLILGLGVFWALRRNTK